MFVLTKLKYLATPINYLNSSITLTFSTCCNGCSREKLITCARDFQGAVRCVAASFLHTSSSRYDLMEFFDDEKNWGASEVKVGRAWKKEELRIKSNSDLHKLWYVLLKERNMLLTMEHEAKEKVALFPNPERLDKVAESMENLESVVRERNRAYFELETGETGEKEAVFDHEELGLKQFPELAGKRISKHIDEHWHYRLMTLFKGSAVAKFKKLYREKIANEERKARNRKRNHVMHLLKRFPHIDTATLEKLYPEVNIRKAMLHKKTLGNHPHNRA
ncbi:hypothetical protein R5R35_007164 [Gryllus longicercus]|uniref:Large ribosomal subunit protein uL29m n=1 Tax=Gryllus longicercus TaxID=2509291 RepID=A0AAN9V0M4_9ORTH